MQKNQFIKQKINAILDVIYKNTIIKNQFKIFLKNGVQVVCPDNYVRSFVASTTDLNWIKKLFVLQSSSTVANWGEEFIIKVNKKY